MPHTHFSVDESTTIDADLLSRMDAYWRAANYLSVGQIYLLDNPLLREPLRPEHIKPRLLGHWGTTPGQNFAYVHLNRVIKRYDLDMFYISGPGHGGPALVANTYLEGTYSDVYPAVTRDEAGLTILFKQFSFPGGIPSHVSPETPGSIHEGGELGYSLSHAFGAAFDNPDLIVACVVGDGEAETGPLATAWHSNKFLNPVSDGAVLPILHLNGYKIANPTILARISHEELERSLQGLRLGPALRRRQRSRRNAPAHGTDARSSCGANPRHSCTGPISRQAVQASLADDRARRARRDGQARKVLDGHRIEGTFRSHQVPLTAPSTNPEQLRLLETWMKSYRPQELFDETGALRSSLAALAPAGDRRMGSNPHANGGRLLKPLECPDFRSYAVAVPAPGAVDAEDTRVLGRFLRDIVRANQAPRTFRIFGPDETASNRLDAVFEATARQWEADMAPDDQWLAPDGSVVEVLSEHQCQGWLEGYLLTGRHGLFNTYEAFAHIVDSMFNQHAKWLKVTRTLPWRRPIASLNYLLSSHVWRQDHNGFTHQDPGFIDVACNKKAEIVRVYLPPDANCLLSVMDHCLRSRQYVNIVVAGKHAAPQWLPIDAAIRHCAAGIGRWDWASNDQGEPDLVMAAAGDVPTLEALAAVALLREALPELRIRFVNVVDLMKLQPATEHPHGLTDAEFDALFTPDKPIIFAYHGYPWLIHRLAYRRTNHRNLHVRGYKEEGTITTPFDMAVLNDLDRFHLAGDAIARLPHLGSRGDALKAKLQALLAEHRGVHPPAWTGHAVRSRLAVAG